MPPACNVILNFHYIKQDHELALHKSKKDFEIANANLAAPSWTNAVLTWKTVKTTNCAERSP